MTPKTTRSLSKKGHITVKQLPKAPEQGASYWIESPNGKREYTHPLFKFPAKFHPPIVRWAIDTFYKDGVILDPFMGSGTVQVEALAKGISSIGIDVDPIAIYISKVKSTPIEPQLLKKEFELLKAALSTKATLHFKEEKEEGGDISLEKFEIEKNRLPIPPIPNISHWFRLYVIIDLAQILKTIDSVRMRNKSRAFFKACFASIIRRVSNAEPGTVSGLEVTTIQSKKNETRKISVYKTFFSKAESEIQNMAELWEARKKTTENVPVNIISGNVNDILKKKKLFEDVTLVITSPPYCRAVEYSRRHYLEMYWLKFVKSQDEQVSLTHTYIGRKLVRRLDWDEQILFNIPELDKTLRRIDKINKINGRTVRHYFYSMEKFFDLLAQATPKLSKVICVVGDSVCCGVPVKTADFISKLAGKYFKFEKKFSYAIQHHHMKYGLWNGDGIKKEHILILSKK